MTLAKVTRCREVLVWPVMIVMLIVFGITAYRFVEMRMPLGFYGIGLGTGYLLRKVTTFRREEKENV